MGSLIKISHDRSGEKTINIEQVDENMLNFYPTADQRGDIPYSNSKQRFNIQGPILK